MTIPHAPLGDSEAATSPNETSSALQGTAVRDQGPAGLLTLGTGLAVTVRRDAGVAPGI